MTLEQRLQDKTPHSEKYLLVDPDGEMVIAMFMDSVPRFLRINIDYLLTVKYPDHTLYDPKGAKPYKAKQTTFQEDQTHTRIMKSKTNSHSWPLNIILANPLYAIDWDEIQRTFPEYTLVEE